MIEKVKQIAIDAGEEIMKIYNGDEDIGVTLKEDESPVTKADKIAHNIIKRKLEEISNYKVLSEEEVIAFDIRKDWKTYWLVDPLDGTKDFIVKNGEFTINIALIENNKPIMGVVYIPLQKDIYYAQKDSGAYKNGEKIYNNSDRTNLIGADSNFHSTEETQDFFKKYSVKDIRKYGSSIKICKLAEGEIDLYPRFNGTKEWDTAASHIIANEAGCKLIDIKTKEELVYSKKNLQNNYFVASRNDLEFEI